jgi:hypothetical protein
VTSDDDDAGPLTGVAILLMSLVLVWSGVLAVGFVWKAVGESGDVPFGRTAVFYVLAAFLGLLSSRTAFELVRRLVRRKRA